MKIRATSYATRQDLAAYAKCRDEGHTSDWCCSHPGGGDNGQGAYGAQTWRVDQAWCALHADVAGKNATVHVTLYLDGKIFGNPFTCKVGDKAPPGVIDLNPGCLKLAGLDPDTELDCEAIISILP